MLQGRWFESCLINQSLVVSRLVPFRVMESMITTTTLEENSNDNTSSKEMEKMREVLVAQGLKHPSPRDNC
jgi:hypothetical protein